MKKRLTSFILVLALSFSLFSVSASAEFTSSDSGTLTNIYKVIQYLNISPSSWQRNSVIGFLERILNAIPSNLSANFALQGGEGTNAILDRIRDYSVNTYNYLSSTNIAGNLGNIHRNTLATADRLLSTNTSLDSIYQAVGDINGFATEETLSFIKRVFSSRFKLSDDYSYSPETPFRLGFSSVFGEVTYGNFNALMSFISTNLGSDNTNGFGPMGYTPTLYHMVKTLQTTLASEDDRKLAEDYKENRDEAKKDFLTGQSGSTSLGKGDFSNASQVGGALNDTFNMGGAAKVSDFLSGFGSAGTESQAWFSQTTANNLNAVEVGDGTSGVSTFADDGETMVDVDPDPYNMRNIFERYDWLEGVNVDD